MAMNKHWGPPVECAVMLIPTTLFSQRPAERIAQPHLHAIHSPLWRCSCCSSSSVSRLSSSAGAEKLVCPGGQRTCVPYLSASCEHA